VTWRARLLGTRRYGIWHTESARAPSVANFGTRLAQLCAPTRLESPPLSESLHIAHELFDFSHKLDDVGVSVPESLD